MNKQAKLKQDQDVAKDDLTIILSYPHVYRFKPICYGMIVAVLNCHSSVITIMEKNDNILCINYTIKTGTVREQVQNLLKRLLFFIKTGFSFVKNSLQSRLRPGVPTTEARVWERCRPGSARGLCGGVGMFICCVGCVFMPCFCIFSGEKRSFYI